jgi:folate-dependent phosphoribosylglycinamide formyltransferase PurN
MRLPDSFWKLCRTRSTAATLLAKSVSFFGNREPGEAKESDLFFELVRNYNIPLVYLSHKKLKTVREEKLWLIKYDGEVNKKIEPFAPDLCVLGGYMLIVSAGPCQKYDMINLHPAPPGGPAGSWQEIIRALIEDKAETAGAMTHLVTPELDRDPVVSYCLFSIRESAAWLERKQSNWANIDYLLSPSSLTEDPHEGNNSDYGNDDDSNQACFAQPTECFTCSIRHSTCPNPVRHPNYHPTG